MINYDKLRTVLKDKNIKWTELRTRLNISTKTVARINKNQANISLEVIERLCDYLELQPCDIIEFIPDKPSKEILEEYEAFMQNPNISPMKKLVKSLEFSKRYGDTYAKELMYQQEIDETEEQ